MQGHATADNLFDVRCSTGPEFDALAEDISSLIIEKHGSNPLYAKFVEALAKGLCGPLRDVDTRKTASALTALGNEKQKAQKDAAGGKKKKAGKPALGAAKGVGAGRADVGAYDEILDDSGEYDDFVSRLGAVDLTTLKLTLNSSRNRCKVSSFVVRFS